jgi:uncharacterized Tic20 family protein
VSVAPAELWPTVWALVSYGAVCVAFGAVFGYVLGPSIVWHLRRWARWLK